VVPSHSVRAVRGHHEVREVRDSAGDGP